MKVVTEKIFLILCFLLLSRPFKSIILFIFIDQIIIITLYSKILKYFKILDKIISSVFNLEILSKMHLVNHWKSR